MSESAASSSAVPLGKYLASTDKKTRDKAIKNLSTFFSASSQDAVSQPEMSKLWKGIFYCFWMSDKPLVQQALASELAEIILTITAIPSSLAFLRGFWQSTVREWNGIDRLRLDKYYMLVRRFVNATFRLMIRTGWEVSTLKEYNDILIAQGGPLCSSDIKVPPSLAYHLADIYMEELDKALALQTLPDPNMSIPVPLASVISPFIHLAARTPTSVTYKRIESALFDPLFSSLSASSRDAEPPSKKRHLENTISFSHIVSNSCLENPLVEGAVEAAVLKKQLLRRLFDVGSQPETRDSNRRRMYAQWKDGAEDSDTEEEQLTHARS